MSPLDRHDIYDWNEIKKVIDIALDEVTENETQEQSTFQKDVESQSWENKVKIDHLLSAMNESNVDKTEVSPEQVKKLADKFNIEWVKTLEDLCEHPKFLQIIQDQITDDGMKEIAKGNKRKIDKYFFDPINNAFDVKTKVYNRLKGDKLVDPQPVANDALKHIQDDFFAFEEGNAKDIAKLATLKTQYPNITIDPKIPNNIQYVIYQSYTRYPELAGKKIRFEYVDGFKVMSSKQHVMRSSVSPKSLIKEMLGLEKNQDREYVIQVNFIEKEGVVTLPKVSQYSKGWVMVHEFGHSFDYARKSPKKMAKFLFGFISSPRRVRWMERLTDESSIARGAGYGLYKFRQEIHQWSASEYVDYKKRTYLGPKEILYAILKYHKSYSPQTLEKVIDHMIKEQY